ncbi:FG-GAP and VCBS repeat-containing protein [Streptomyces sp. GC420]|uniref:FG-GAP and VCBS repeat-containing protein n=1 Tax=Streptomyces sp. GC420 TaxID=2697568 RepID=UPI001414F75B|nr:FG-GAP and VCBS repeat-containing protein [Streptomyces sp. GC420]NBM15142.1 hypothetical protein [Streptomyces sp. GC420]
MRRRALALALATATATAATSLLASPVAGAASARVPAVPYDFDGDGHRDLAVGVPGGGTGGYVSVVPGSADGPATAEKFRISQASSGVSGTDEKGDAFGTEPVSADLNEDGYADLVVGVPGEDRAGDFAPGRVVILWGSGSAVPFTRSTSVTSSTTEEAGGLGVSLADVNGDGRLDIVTADNGDEADKISVAPGPFAPGAAPAKLARVEIVPHFTHLWDMATGDFDGDGYDDLVYSSSPYEVGARIVMMRGTPSGLVETDSWYQEAGGRQFAAGDLDADGYDDLVAGGAFDVADPWDEEWQGRYPVAKDPGGTVRIMYGSPAGPAGTRAPVDVHQSTAGVPGASELGDEFGGALAIGDADGDRRPDLAVGAPGEDLGSDGGGADAGAVTVLYGTPQGPDTQRARVFHQGSPSVPGACETGDAFGAQLQLSDLTRDGRAELLAAAPGENADSGGVWSLPGSTTGTTGTGSVALTPGKLGLPSPASALRYGRHLGN